MSVSHRMTLGLLLALAFVAGCGGCGGRQGPKGSAAAYFPKSTALFLTVEDPGRLGGAAGRFAGMKLMGLARAAVGASEGEDLFQPLVAQLGFDPRGAEGFALAGIDWGRALALGEDDEGRRLLVAGITDRGAAEKWIAAQAKREGGLTRTERIWKGTEKEPVRPVEIPTLLGSDGEVRIAYAVSGKWIVASRGKDAVEAVGRAVARKEEESLAATASYAAARERLGPGRTIWGWMPPEKKKGGKRGLWDRGFSFGLSVGDDDLDLRLRIPQGLLEASILQAAANQVAGAELLPYLSNDDFLLTRIGGDPLGLQPVLQAFFPSTFRQLKRAGIDPARELLAHFHPGIVLGIALEPEPNLSGGLPVQPSLSSTNPFHFVHTALVAKLKDPSRFSEVLEKLAASGEKLKMEVSVREEEGLRIYAAKYEAGEGLTWAVVGDKLLAAGGEGAFGRLLARARGEASPFQARDPRSWQTFEGAASAAFLDVPLLVEQLRGIPESSFGIGGFRLKAVMDSWVSMLEELRGVTVAFQADGEGLVLDAKVGIR